LEKSYVVLPRQASRRRPAGRAVTVASCGKFRAIPPRWGEPLSAKRKHAARHCFNLFRSSLPKIAKRRVSEAMARHVYGAGDMAGGIFIHFAHIDQHIRIADGLAHVADVHLRDMCLGLDIEIMGCFQLPIL
jgi:hypothetical protein